MLTPLYRCPKCGDTWQVESYEFIDTDRDDVEPAMICSACFSVVRPVINDEGIPVYHELTDEEVYWITGGFDDIDPDEYIEQ